MPYFPAGQTRAEFTVDITDDSVIEATESFQLLLSIPEDLISKGVQVGPNSAATVTIMDNDGELNGINCVHGCSFSFTADIIRASLVCTVCLVSNLYIYIYVHIYVYCTLQMTVVLICVYQH